MKGLEPNMVANGNVAPSRAVKVDTGYTAGLRVIQGTAGSRNIGISQEGTRNPGGFGNDDGYAAIAGEDLKVYHAGEVCQAELGGSVTVGASLKSDSDGKLVATTTAGDIICAIALQGGVSGDLPRVWLVPPHPYG